MALRYLNTLSQATDGSANSLAGAKLNFYTTGTLNRLTTFSDNGLTSANANPVVADGSGRFVDIFLQKQIYRVIFTDKDDVTIDDHDPVDGTVLTTGAFSVVSGAPDDSVAIDASGNVDMPKIVSIGDFTEKTIASGVITITSSFHTVDTEGDASTDNLDTINGGILGARLILVANNAARTVVVKDATGNLRTAGDFSLDTGGDTMELIFQGAVWLELTRSNNT